MTATRGRPRRPAAGRAALWACPRCGRRFRQARQRHACGVGRRDEILAGRAPALVRLYLALEKRVRAWRAVEVVTRDRYALFRTTRIFADLVVMKEALRIAVHLPRRVRDPMFFKAVAGRGRQVSHVALVRTAGELRAVVPFVREAYDFARGERGG